MESNQKDEHFRFSFRRWVEFESTNPSQETRKTFRTVGWFVLGFMALFTIVVFIIWRS